jgi:hypothetical protein
VFWLSFAPGSCISLFPCRISSWLAGPFILAVVWYPPLIFSSFCSPYLCWRSLFLAEHISSHDIPISPASLGAVMAIRNYRLSILENPPSEQATDREVWLYAAYLAAIGGPAIKEVTSPRIRGWAEWAATRISDRSTDWCDDSLCDFISLWTIIILFKRTVSISVKWFSG